MNNEMNSTGHKETAPQFQMVMHDVESFHAPIYAHFSKGEVHIRRARGEWAAAQLFQDMQSHLVGSEVELNLEQPGADARIFRRLLFRPSPDLFIELRSNSLDVYAASLDEAARQLAALVARYSKTSTTASRFQILSADCGIVHSKPVSLPESGLMPPDDLALHYGDDFPSWETAWLSSLHARRGGVSILRGAPGTGKTTFLRHLVHRLRDTHRFFYVPVTHQSLLSNPELASFWVQQNDDFPKHRTVVLLEDSESLLEERHPDNRGHVANLLNISDGLLGDFLKMHVICTLNCTMDRLDTAILRPGRMHTCRQFRRLSPEEARRLAAAKGLTLKDQPDYSLAEIYHQPILGGEPAPARQVGFGILN
jgi:hypothetical protein